MAPKIAPVEASAELPAQTEVAVIGGGIVGLAAALVLAERGIPVTVLEKGRIAGEQSSRNLGWVRKTSRAPADLPLALAADRLWAELPARTGRDVGYRQAGIMFLARSEAELQAHETWLGSVNGLGLGSRMLGAAEIGALVPGGAGSWAGGVFTPSDGRAEPTLAASTIAAAAIAKGAKIIEGCAVRGLQTSGGRVSGVVTERGEVTCNAVLLAGGLWSRRFLGNLGIALPALPLTCSVFRTASMEGPTDIAVGGPDFSFRKHADGGYVITQRGALSCPLVADHLLIGMRYLHLLRDQRGLLRITVNRQSLDDLRLKRRWRQDRPSPFETVRVMDPPTIPTLNEEALANLSAAWPAFAGARIEEAWAGTMDITPDSNPVIGPAARIPGLTLATGFSGHGFGTAPAAGQLAADLVTGAPPLVDPAPYRLERF
ncbi:FAD-binding oxidoreductase [Mangrovicoccus sp. HB161399]|uniref:NAD(P)/FAD-dependent oxidoreductase n=1 Tax=Mangrovicoccus sp. HB161399 TaxID=2720392 RepID=UPI001554396A|nr:FAD-binding oxidoreductase [Mangrovicoccus sp. HB161399]